MNNQYRGRRFKRYLRDVVRDPDNIFPVSLYSDKPDNEGLILSYTFSKIGEIKDVVISFECEKEVATFEFKQFHNSTQQSVMGELESGKSNLISTSTGPLIIRVVSGDKIEVRSDDKVRNINVGFSYKTKR